MVKQGVLVYRNYVIPRLSHLDIYKGINSIGLVR